MCAFVLVGWKRCKVLNFTSESRTLHYNPTGCFKWSDVMNMKQLSLDIFVRSPYWNYSSLTVCEMAYGCNLENPIWHFVLVSVKYTAKYTMDWLCASIFQIHPFHFFLIKLPVVDLIAAVKNRRCTRGSSIKSEEDINCHLSVTYTFSTEI